MAAVDYYNGENFAEEEEVELPKLNSQDEIMAESSPLICPQDSKILVDAYGFYKKLDPEDICPDVPQVAAQNIVRRYTLINQNKVSVQIINYGATITSIVAPDRDGNMADIVLGFDDVTDYVCERELRMGSTIGRYAGLISDGEFKIGNREHFLSTNYKITDHRHGGCLGFDSVLWDSFVRRDRVIMTYSSYANEEGYPGQLMVQVSFRLTHDNRLVVQTTATSSQPTPTCITHQPYFNLAGHATGPEGLTEHCITINADRYVVMDEKCGRPTGELQFVGGTYYDLRVPRPLGKGIEKAPGGKGYNMTFCLTKGAPKTSVTFAARLVHPFSGRYLEILTDHPGLYFYTCGDLPNPDMPPLRVEGIPYFFGRDTGELDDDGMEQRKLMDRMEWPRPASLEQDDKQVELVPEQEDRCETPPPAQQDLEDPDYFPRNEMDCAFEQEMTDSAMSLHEETDMESDWEPPLPVRGKNGARYRNDSGVVMMPMEYPDSIKHCSFPTPILYPGEVYSRTIIYKFGIAPARRKESTAKLLQEFLASQKSDPPSDLEAKSASLLNAN